MFSYSCPACSTVLKSDAAAPVGKKIKCRKCEHAWVAAPALDAAPPAGKAMPVAAKKATPAKAAPAAPVAPAPRDVNSSDARPNPEGFGSDDDNPYGVVHEEDTVEMVKAKAQIQFDGVQDKNKRSARGPAMAMLVLPTNLLIAEGVLTFIAGLIMAVAAAFPLVFTDVEASDDEYVEQGVWMFLGIMLLVWGMLVCLGASRMQNLESYTWGMVGAVLGIMPLLVGIFALIVLRDPKVVAGFEEVEGALDEDEDGDEDEDDGEDGDDDEDD
jgi:predicted Zn finger-like uncharacterized protein